jgi:hypothetical protein
MDADLRNAVRAVQAGLIDPVGLIQALTLNNISVTFHAEQTYGPDVVHYGKGMQFRVNGYTLSCQAGQHNYCSVRNEKMSDSLVREDCEIACWDDETREWFDFSHDQVLGYVTWGKVLKIVLAIANLREPTRDQVNNILQEVTRVV